MITSEPPGATIWVDRVEKGRTPCELELEWKKDETHTLEVFLGEYDRQNKLLSYEAAKRAPKRWPQEFSLGRLQHAVEVRIDTTPSAAAISIEGHRTGTSPVTVPIRFTRSAPGTPWSRAGVTAELTDFFPASSDVSYMDASKGTLALELSRAVHTLDVRFETVPDGASISVDGQRAGTSPTNEKVRFTRVSPGSPWSVVNVEAELADHLPSRSQLTYEAALRGVSALPELARVRHEVPVNILCNVPGAEVSVDGRIVGQTPLRHPFVFVRGDARSAWRSFVVTVTKDGYRWRRRSGVDSPGDTTPFATTMDYAAALGGDLKVELEPIKFVWTKLQYYKFDGQQLGVAEELVLAQVGEVETEPMVQSVTRMTDRGAGELIDTRLWVAPPEQQLVYSVPFQRQDVQAMQSNLWKQTGQGLTRLTDGPVIDIHACVSPDGQFSYFSANRLGPDKFNLWRVRMTGQGGFTKITDSPSSRIDWQPMVSPDGARIAYTSWLLGVELPQIWIANADGTLPTQLRFGESPAWSPDGSQLAYVAKDNEGFDQIWIMNADGSKPTQLTSGKVRHEDPIWTPNGKRIVYSSNEAINAEGLHNFDIWIMNVEGTNRTQLTVNGSRDYRPAISADGKYIYFLSNRGAKTEKQSYWQVWRMELKQ